VRSIEIFCPPCFEPHARRLGETPLRVGVRLLAMIENLKRLLSQDCVLTEKVDLIPQSFDGTAAYRNEIT